VDRRVAAQWQVMQHLSVENDCSYFDIVSRFRLCNIFFGADIFAAWAPSRPALIKLGKKIENPSRPDDAAMRVAGRAISMLLSA
jgi:hypothetical protein